VTGNAAVQLILASASPARLSTLRAAGIDPLVQVSAVDEAAVLAATGVTEPDDVPLLLAKAKAEDVAAGLDFDGIVLGCDSVLDLDGVALGKPADSTEAVQRWKDMRGRSGRLYTGHWLIDLREPGDGGTSGSVGGVSAATVYFADLSDEEIELYVATGEPLQVAGAFTVDGLGGAFVTGIDGDYHGVVGVSLPLLRELLAQIDIAWTSLWKSQG
jgi:septum formation protein